MQNIAYLRDGPFKPSFEGGSKSILGMIRAFAKHSNVYLFRCYRGWEDSNVYKDEPFTTVFIRPKDFYTNKLLYKDLCEKYNIDVCFFDSTEAVNIQASLFPKNVKKIWEVINVDHTLIDRLTPAAKEVELTIRMEKESFNLVDLMLVRSDKDKNDLLEIGAPADKIEKYFGAIDVSEVKFNDTLTNDNNIIFLGNIFYVPNENAVNLILDKVVAPVISSTSDCKFLFVGPYPTYLLKKAIKFGKSVEFLGEKEFPTEVLQLSRVALCPVFEASGTRLKLLDYLAAGIPTISSTIGIEGLHHEIREHIVVEDDINQYPKHITSLINNIPSISKRNQGRRFVERHYSWDTEGERILREILI